jgi:16S rRNA (adenine1518-N6/adenine1519-N6)-dimethyltransferase
VIARYGLSARKSLGQHFLLDLNLTRRIARAAGDLSEGTVLEIGPGPGGLTRALLETGVRQLIVIERDTRCIAALRDLSGTFPGRLEVIEGDALAIDLAKLGIRPRRVVANLPYNLSTVLLISWLTSVAELRGAFAGFTLMFQKEVADRLVARPATKDYGRLSVMTQWLCESRVLFEVSPRAFTPPPKVTSSVVALAPRTAPLCPAPRWALERVTGAAFGQRRKMLRQSLRSLGMDPAALISAAGVPETARGEALGIDQFCALARAFATAATGPSARPSRTR